jgi:hypothetical protein
MRSLLLLRLVPIASAVLACGATAPPKPCGPCASAGARAGLARSAKVEQLARQRVDLAGKRLVLLRASFAHGAATLDELFAGFRDVAFAARDSGMRGEALRHVLTDYRDGVKSLRELTKERVAKGAATEEALSRVDALVAEAEYWLAEASEGT